VLELDPSYLRTIAALSELLLKTGQVGETEALIARARQLQPDDPEILLPAGQCHVKRKEWNQAVSVLCGLLEKQPDHLQAHFFLAQALKEQRKVKEAMEHFANRDGVGARLRLHIGSTVLERQKNGGGSCLSAHDGRVHFGLGSATKVDRLEVIWPSGKTQMLEHLYVNQVVKITEPPC